MIAKPNPTSTRHGRRPPLSTVASVILGLLISPGCHASDGDETVRSGRIGIFVEAESNCTLSPDKIVRPHIAPGEQIISPDDRWVAFARPDASQHLIELFDRETKAKIVLYHPNIEVMLMDLAFSADSRTLTFIGTPWGVHGISEIFIIDLQSLEISQYGEIGHDYRFPVVISSQQELMFLESKAKLLVQGKTLLELASRESISYFVGFRSADNSVRYLLDVTEGDVGKFSGGLQQLFAPFLSHERRFLEVNPSPAFGIIAEPDRGKAVIYDATAQREADDPPSGKFRPLELGKIGINISNPKRVEVTIENVEFQREVDQVGDRIWKKNSNDAQELLRGVESSSICLKVAQIQ